MSENLRETLARRIGQRLAAGGRRPLVVGISGAQGSGKSTLASDLVADLSGQGMAAAVLSLDDLYLTREERARLASRVHPLLATRGVPGTHDLSLAFAAIAALERGEAARLPRFDKARDERRPAQDWDHAPAGTQVLLLEGWCLGAAPQEPAALADPVNALERDEDPDLRWRSFVNRALERDYRILFARVDLTVLLAAPGFEAVFGWRRQQERELAERTGGTGDGLMNDAALDRFIAHYERLTRHILAELPGRADIVARLGPDRAVLSLMER
jgi:D-glycerate 3-kinase